jgi:hypothetical protein
MVEWHRSRMATPSAPQQDGAPGSEVQTAPRACLVLSLLLALAALGSAAVERRTLFELRPAGYRPSVETFSTGAASVEIDPGAPDARFPYVLPGRRTDGPGRRATSCGSVCFKAPPATRSSTSTPSRPTTRPLRVWWSP